MVKTKKNKIKRGSRSRYKNNKRTQKKRGGASDTDFIDKELDKQIQSYKYEIRKIDEERNNIAKFIRENKDNPEQQEKIQEEEKRDRELFLKIQSISETGSKLVSKILEQKKKLLEQVQKKLPETSCESEEYERDTLVNWVSRFGDKKWTELYKDKPIIVILAHGKVHYNSRKHQSDPASPGDIFVLPFNTQLISTERSGNVGLQGTSRNVDPITNNGKHKVSILEDIIKSSMNPQDETLYLLEDNGITRKPPFLYPEHVLKRKESNRTSVACQKLYREGDTINNIHYNFNDHNNAFLYYHYQSHINPLSNASSNLSFLDVPRIIDIPRLFFTNHMDITPSTGKDGQELRWVEPHRKMIQSRWKSGETFDFTNKILTDKDELIKIHGNEEGERIWEKGENVDEYNEKEQEKEAKIPRTLTVIYIFNSQYSLEDYIDRLNLRERKFQIVREFEQAPRVTLRDALNCKRKIDLINLILSSKTLVERKPGNRKGGYALTEKRVGKLPSNTDKYNFNFNISNGKTTLYDIMQLLGEGTYISHSCKSFHSEVYSDKEVVDLARVISQKRHVPSEVVGKEAGFWYY